MNNLACEELHQLLSRVAKLEFSFERRSIPASGVYVLFETGELGHGTDRIVRVGTHRGVNNLASRLTEHFLNENKDRSIFRKNIGRAILNRDADPFLSQWEVDFTSRKAREGFSGSVDAEKLRSVEEIVTAYIRTNFRFTVIPADEDRLPWESALISIISSCNECRPSENWLGLRSPIKKIRDSGLWLVQGLNKPLAKTWNWDAFQASVGLGDVVKR